ncbi:MAG: amino acid permease [Bacteroidales bacterium]|nr:amino acid permease [Bacteroidales bacterium]
MLKREIRRWDLVLLMINSIIGAGIFGLPSTIFGQSGLYSIPAIFACGLVVFIIALCFAEVASRFSKTGGPYLYTLNAFGKIPAVTIGWILMITRLATYAAQINLLASYLGYFHPVLALTISKQLTIIIITLFLTFITYRGVKTSTFTNNLLAIAKLLPLLLFVIVGAFFINPELFELQQTPPPLPEFSKSIFVLIFAFTGFEAILVNTGEMKDPHKNIPFALITAILFVALFYGLIQFVCIGTLPGLQDSEFPLTAAASIFMGPLGATLISIGAVLSIGGALNTVMLVGSRIPFAFSEEKQLPGFFSRLHPRFSSPVWSLLTFSAAALFVSLTGTFIYAVTISVISKILIMLTICAALIKFRKSDKTNTDYYRLRFGKTIAVITIIACLWLLTGTKASEVIAVMITIASGLSLYFVYRFFSRLRRNRGEE